MSSFEHMTRTRAECKTDLILDDGSTILIPNASITIKDRELFNQFRSFYGNKAGKIVETFLAVGMAFAGYVIKHEGMSIDEILDAILKEDEE